MIRNHILNIVKKIPFTGSFLGVSGGHTEIEKNEATKTYWSNQWKNEALPEKQRAIVDKEIADIKKGHYPKHMKVLVDMIRSLNAPEEKILEIGCSSGYYSEIFQNAGIPNLYEGCDYSEKFIALAQKTYPNTPFRVCDNTELPYQTNSFGMVISGCCILHITDYQKAIQETARVAEKYIIWSRTPVVHEHATIFSKKKGYGIDMVEIIFQEEELFSLFRKNGLTVMDVQCIGMGPKVHGIHEQTFIKTYLCRK